MEFNRRHFLKSSAGAGLLASLQGFSCSGESEGANYESLDQVLSEPVLRTGFFSQPVIIENIEFLRYENNFIARVRSTDGAVGYSVSNNMQMVSLYPIVLNRIIPFFIGKDAVQLDSLIDGVYTYRSNYKLQGLALWVSLATVEFAILDLLGRISGKAMCELIGDIHNREIAVYQANNHRGETAEVSVEKIKKSVEETGARAVKFKLGGRMSNNREDPPGRTEKLIPLVRQALGDDMTIYADSNGSYTVDKAIEIGRILEENRIDFYEEPVPFDWYDETRQVTMALNVPIAGGEQEPSMHNFRWLIGNDALDIVQPDMFYFGGMIRSMRVARMAHSVNKPCIPHISGSGLGYLYMMHFVAAIPNAGPYHEFKGFNADIPFEGERSMLERKNGKVKVPLKPGAGIELDPGFIKKHKPVVA
jgi:L-alanine-DL-glutamate epimerase-like enolase superfamily enzyme